MSIKYNSHCENQIANSITYSSHHEYQRNIIDAVFIFAIQVCLIRNNVLVCVVSNAYYSSGERNLTLIMKDGRELIHSER